MIKSSGKVISIVITVFLVLSFMTFGASAHEVGDVIYYAQPTNIAASVNGYQIMSYNVDGLTYICAEDLIHYGFDVTYNNETRSLGISRNSSSSIAPHISNSNDFWKIGSNKEKIDILYTDIVTYVNDTYVNSFNIDGKTIICFNDLSPFGTVNYNNDLREISLHTDSIDYNPVATFIEGIRDDEIANLEPQFTNALKKQYGDNASGDIILRAKGNVMVYEMYINGVDLNIYQKRTEQKALQNMESAVKTNFAFLKETLPELSAVAFIIYDQSGLEIAAITIALD